MARHMGGTGGCTDVNPLGCGTVFKLSLDGTYTVLHSFTFSDGAYPVTGLIADSAGNLYGTTPDGGGSRKGVVFKLAPDRTETVLYSFKGPPSDGGNLTGGLYADSSGNLYGATFAGGAGTCTGLYPSTPGCGAVFKLTGTGFGILPCASGDAALANKQFPVQGELTYDISSPARILQSISLTASTNIGSFTLPTVSSGGHSAAGGVFIKSNPNETATFELEAAFITPSFACAIDPTTATVEIDTGNKAVLGIQMVPGSEHFIEIDNGSPGLNWLRIEANGKYLRSLSLSSGKTTNVNASQAMSRAENTLTFTGEGKTGSYANIDLSDSAPQSGAKQAAGAGRLMFGF
jgi:uncharacterized repeat protein (TIGR03803 family)